jgi:hypothetical protein
MEPLLKSFEEFLMHRYSLNVPSTQDRDQVTAEFATVIELARQRAGATDSVVYIGLAEALPGQPNCWAVSPKGYVFVEGVQLPRCHGCGD